MLLASLLCGLLFAVRSDWGVFILTCLNAIAPGATICGIIYMRGYPRAFFIGATPLAVFSSLLTLNTLSNGLMIPIYADSTVGEEMWDLKLMTLLPLGLVFAAGAAGMLVRFWAVRSACGVERKGVGDLCGRSIE